MNSQELGIINSVRPPSSTMEELEWQKVDTSPRTKTIDFPTPEGYEIVECTFEKPVDAVLGIGITSSQPPTEGFYQVRRILADSVCSKDPKVQVGDRLVSINEYNLYNVTMTTALDLLKQNTDYVTIVLLRDTRTGKHSPEVTSSSSSLRELEQSVSESPSLDLHLDDDEEDIGDLLMLETEFDDGEDEEEMDAAEEEEERGMENMKENDNQNVGGGESVSLTRTQPVTLQQYYNEFDVPVTDIDALLSADEDIEDDVQPSSPKPESLVDDVPEKRSVTSSASSSRLTSPVRDLNNIDEIASDDIPALPPPLPSSLPPELAPDAEPVKEIIVSDLLAPVSEVTTKSVEIPESMAVLDEIPVIPDEGTESVAIEVAPLLDIESTPSVQYEARHPAMNDLASSQPKEIVPIEYSGKPSSNQVDEKPSEILLSLSNEGAPSLSAEVQVQHAEVPSVLQNEVEISPFDDIMSPMSSDVAPTTADEELPSQQVHTVSDERPLVPQEVTPSLTDGITLSPLNVVTPPLPSDLLLQIGEPPKLPSAPPPPLPSAPPPDLPTMPPPKEPLHPEVTQPDTHPAIPPTAVSQTSPLSPSSDIPAEKPTKAVFAIKKRPMMSSPGPVKSQQMSPPTPVRSILADRGSIKAITPVQPMTPLSVISQQPAISPSSSPRHSPPTSPKSSPNQTEVHPRGRSPLRLSPDENMKQTPIGGSKPWTEFAKSGGRLIESKVVAKYKRSEDGPFLIQLLKGFRELGIKVSLDANGRAVVNELSSGGAAARDGHIRAGDILLAVNGKDLAENPSANPQDILNTLPRGTVRLILQSSNSINKDKPALEEIKPVTRKMPPVRVPPPVPPKPPSPFRKKAPPIPPDPPVPNRASVNDEEPFYLVDTQVKGSDEYMDSNKDALPSEEQGTLIKPPVGFTSDGDSQVIAASTVNADSGDSFWQGEVDQSPKDKSSLYHQKSESLDSADSTPLSPRMPPDGHEFPDRRCPSTSPPPIPTNKPPNSGKVDKTNVPSSPISSTDIKVNRVKEEQNNNLRNSQTTSELSYSPPEESKNSTTDFQRSLRATIPVRTAPWARSQDSAGDLDARSAWTEKRTLPSIPLRRDLSDKSKPTNSSDRILRSRRKEQNDPSDLSVQDKASIFGNVVMRRKLPSMPGFRKSRNLEDHDVTADAGSQEAKGKAKTVVQRLPLNPHLQPARGYDTSEDSQQPSPQEKKTSPQRRTYERLRQRDGVFYATPTYSPQADKTTQEATKVPMNENGVLNSQSTPKPVAEGKDDGTHFAVAVVYEVQDDFDINSPEAQESVLYDISSDGRTGFSTPPKEPIQYDSQTPNSSLYETPGADSTHFETSMTPNSSLYETPPPHPPQYQTASNTVQQLPDEHVATVEKTVHREMPLEEDIIHEAATIVDVANHSADTSVSEKSSVTDEKPPQDEENKADTSVSEGTSVSEDITVEVVEEDDTSVSGVASESEEQQEIIEVEVTEAQLERRDSSSSDSSSVATLEDSTTAVTPPSLPASLPPQTLIAEPQSEPEKDDNDEGERTGTIEEIVAPTDSEVTAPSVDIIENVESLPEVPQNEPPISIATIPSVELLPEINLDVSNDETFDLSDVPPPLPTTPPVADVAPSIPEGGTGEAFRVPSPVLDENINLDDAPPLPACPPPMFDSPSVDTDDVLLTDDIVHDLADEEITADESTEPAIDTVEASTVEIALQNASEQLTELTQDQITAEVDTKQSVSTSDSESNISSSTSSTPRTVAPPLKTVDAKIQSPLNEPTRLGGPKLKGLTIPNKPSSHSSPSSTLPRSATKKTPPTLFLKSSGEPSPSSSTRFSLKFSLTSLRPVEKKKEDSPKSPSERSKVGSRYLPKMEFPRISVPAKDKETDKPKAVSRSEPPSERSKSLSGSSQPVTTDTKVQSSNDSEISEQVKPEIIETEKESKSVNIDAGKPLGENLEPKAEVQPIVVHTYVENVAVHTVDTAPPLETMEVERLEVASEESLDRKDSTVQMSVKPDVLPDETKETQIPESAAEELPVVSKIESTECEAAPGDVPSNLTQGRDNKPMSTVPLPASTIEKPVFPETDKQTSPINITVSPKDNVTSAGKLPSPLTKKGYHFFQSNKTETPQSTPVAEAKENPSDKPAQDMTAEVAAQRKAMLKESMSPSGSQAAKDVNAAWAPAPNAEDPYKYVTLRKKPEPVRGGYVPTRAATSSDLTSKTDVVRRRTPKQYSTPPQNRWSTPVSLDYRQGRLSTDRPSSRIESQESPAELQKTPLNDDSSSASPLERRYLRSSIDSSTSASPLEQRILRTSAINSPTEKRYPRTSTSDSLKASPLEPGYLRKSEDTSVSGEKPSFREIPLERRYGRAPRIGEKPATQEGPTQHRYERAAFSDRKSASVDQDDKSATSEPPVRYRYGKPSQRPSTTPSERRWSTPMDVRYERLSSPGQSDQSAPELPTSPPPMTTDEAVSMKTSTPLTNRYSWRSRTTEDSPSSSPRPYTSQRLRLSDIGSGNGSDSDGATLDDDRARSSPRPFDWKKAHYTGELAQLIEEANQSIEEMHDDSLMVVVLRKDDEHQGLGLTIAGGSDQEIQDITVHRVIHGGLASREGRLQPGDRLLSINGKSLQGVTHAQAHGYLKVDRSYFVLVVSKKSSPWKPEGAKITEGKAVTVELEKGVAGVGFSLEGGKNSPKGDVPITVKRVFTGGAAEKSGSIHVGDVLLKINGEDVSEKTHFEAWTILKKLPDGKVTLEIVKQEKTS
ncbi:PDZ domain-containing protein 2-like isoform X2 [Ptychodera flava]|uniref:PDZ domain-containing protein 2-like isoform X2 n=1 Tax=Ptychodera flava TaxID=63121 RepID=UPI003969F168